MVIVIAIAFRLTSMCSSTCEVMSIRSAIGVLSGWQTFAFSIAHALLFEFLLSVDDKLCPSMCEVMHIRSDRCPLWMADVSIFCCTHSSVWLSLFGVSQTIQHREAVQPL